MRASILAGVKTRLDDPGCKDPAGNPGRGLSEVHPDHRQEEEEDQEERPRQARQARQGRRGWKRGEREGLVTHDLPQHPAPERDLRQAGRLPEAWVVSATSVGQTPTSQNSINH